LLRDTGWQRGTNFGSERNHSVFLGDLNYRDRSGRNVAAHRFDVNAEEL
jgi:hypothetical protein